MLIDKEKNQVNASDSAVKDTDIAIIGMAGKFPMADNLEQFWSNLKQGKYCVGDIPEARVKDWESLMGEGIKRMPQFGYLSSISQFDSEFFRMPPGEAILIDPAQRMLIETVYHALEYAGYTDHQDIDSRTGVFIAGGGSEYLDLISPDDYSMISEVGNISAVSAGRISHFFDLRGPSLIINTACSSSFTALHYACQSIKGGESSMAIVGAVNVYAYLPSLPLGSDNREKKESSSNRCKVFDDSTSGVVNGEGVGAIILKPLKQALKDNDVICAVLKGTAISHNGARTAAISGQKPEALAEVIGMALENAEVNPATLSYIEASGTATKLGDPIEVEAIVDAFSRYTQEKNYCAIGSVKANVGHLNHTSGLASLIKVILALQHKQIPPLARFEKPNSYIDFNASPLYIQKELKDWTLGENNVRRAGVSSFSVNGTNCHAIIEEAPQQIETYRYPDYCKLLTVSAKNQESLHALRSQLMNCLGNDSSAKLDDVCYTMNLGRSQYEYRFAVVGKDKKEILEGLSIGEPRNLLKHKGNKSTKSARQDSKAVFLFPGGKSTAHLLETCRDFYRKDFVAGKYMQECAAFYDLETYPQVMMFAFQYALAKLWLDLGIKPAFVLGFGIGKYVSRVISCKLKLHEALNTCVNEYNQDNFFNFDEMKFKQHIDLLISKGQKRFLEIGAENTMIDMVRTAAKEKNGIQALASYHPEDKEKTLLESIRIVYSQGVALDFSALYYGRKMVLPNYPFHHQRHWVKIEDRIKNENKSAINTHVPHEADDDQSTRDVKETIIHIWHTFFGVQDLDSHDDFFQLGGDSLKAMGIISKIHKQLNVSVPLIQFFSCPTIQGLTDYIEKSDKSAFMAIHTAEKREYYPLSSVQMRLYILQEMEENNIVYNLPNAMEFIGDLQRALLLDSVNKTIQRHESFRTSFVTINGNPVQKISDQAEIKIEYHDMRGSIDAAGDARAFFQDPFIKPFDLSLAPLLRIGLIRIDELRYVLMTDIHHIISDAVSSTLMINDFIAHYSGKQLPPPKLQYKDYTHWQRSGQGWELKKRQEDYWLDIFSGEIQALNMPIDYPRPKVQGFEGSTIRFYLAKEDVKSLKDLALKENVTSFMLLLAIYNILLAKITGQQDIVVGTVIEGRSHEDLRAIIGIFVNTLALRNNPKPEHTFSQFLQNVKEVTLGAFENGDYQFDTLVETLEINRDISRNPLFDVAFEFQEIKNNPQEREQLTDLEVRPFGYKRKISIFDMSFLASQFEDNISIRVEYNSGLFKKETIEKFIAYFKVITSSVLQDPGICLSAIEVIDKEEKDELIKKVREQKGKSFINKNIEVNQQLDEEDDGDFNF
jgi:acyl transferase domain-containing protein